MASMDGPTTHDVESNPSQGGTGGVGPAVEVLGDRVAKIKAMAIMRKREGKVGGNRAKRGRTKDGYTSHLGVQIATEEEVDEIMKGLPVLKPSDDEDRPPAPEDKKVIGRADERELAYALLHPHQTQPTFRPLPTPYVGVPKPLIPCSNLREALEGTQSRVGPEYESESFLHRPMVEDVPLAGLADYPQPLQPTVKHVINLIEHRMISPELERWVMNTVLEAEFVDDPHVRLVDADSIRELLMLADTCQQLGKLPPTAQKLIRQHLFVRPLSSGEDTIGTVLHFGHDSGEFFGMMLVPHQTNPDQQRPWIAIGCKEEQVPAMRDMSIALLTLFEFGVKANGKRAWADVSEEVKAGMPDVEDVLFVPKDVSTYADVVQGLTEDEKAELGETGYEDEDVLMNDTEERIFRTITLIINGMAIIDDTANLILSQDQAAIEDPTHHLLFPGLQDRQLLLDLVERLLLAGWVSGTPITTIREGERAGGKEDGLRCLHGEVVEMGTRNAIESGDGLGVVALIGDWRLVQAALDRTDSANLPLPSDIGYFQYTHRFQSVPQLLHDILEFCRDSLPLKGKRDVQICCISADGVYWRRVFAAPIRAAIRGRTSNSLFGDMMLLATNKVTSGQTSPVPAEGETELVVKNLLAFDVRDIFDKAFNAKDEDAAGKIIYDWIIKVRADVISFLWVDLWNLDEPSDPMSFTMTFSLFGLRDLFRLSGSQARLGRFMMGYACPMGNWDTGYVSEDHVSNTALNRTWVTATDKIHGQIEKALKYWCKTKGQDFAVMREQRFADGRQSLGILPQFPEVGGVYLGIDAIKAIERNHRVVYDRMTQHHLDHPERNSAHPYPTLDITDLQPYSSLDVVLFYTILLTRIISFSVGKPLDSLGYPPIATDAFAAEEIGVKQEFGDMRYFLHTDLRHKDMAKLSLDTGFDIGQIDVSDYVCEALGGKKKAEAFTNKLWDRSRFEVVAQEVDENGQ